MTNTINLGIQLVPLNNDTNFKLIDEAIAIIKKHNFKTIVTPFETVVECSFEEGTAILNQLNELCNNHSNLTWLLNVRIHAKTGADIIMEHKTAKHN
jgi:uncharacterized protein YqgV (UPF0045/DUF77 family)